MEPILTFGVNPGERFSLVSRETFTASYAPFAIWRRPYAETRQVKVPRELSRGKILSNSLTVSDSIDRRAFQCLITRAYGRDKIHLRAFPFCGLNERAFSGNITR
jgi:hypothetical protein